MRSHRTLCAGLLVAAFAWSQTAGEAETFLRTAAIVSTRTSESGSTVPLRATLSDGTLTHDAQIQCVDIARQVWRGSDGTVEKNFRDSWRYNIAAWRVAGLLGIDMVPVSVERSVNGKRCAVTWWVDDVWLVEAERRQKGIPPPATNEWVTQMNTIRVFDQLIANTDRNQGNLLITREWKVWMIDHTRAFRTSAALLRPDTLRRIDPALLNALRSLDETGLRREAGEWLQPEELSPILARRDAIVSFFERQMREKGEAAVLTPPLRTGPGAETP